MTIWRIIQITKNSKIRPTPYYQIPMVMDGLDGSEVYHQDHDNDGMWSGWEFYFDFDPFDAADAFVDSDGDGYNNRCENKWNTNPKDPTSFPSQGELCTND